VIEFQTNDIRFTAVYAGVFRQVLPKPLPLLFDHRLVAFPGLLQVILEVQSIVPLQLLARAKPAARLANTTPHIPPVEFRDGFSPMASGTDLPLHEAIPFGFWKTDALSS
jgi:hypothetical protein